MKTAFIQYFYLAQAIGFADTPSALAFALRAYGSPAVLLPRFARSIRTAIILFLVEINMIIEGYYVKNDI